MLFAGGDVDLYGYCLNDPVNIIDSNGLISKYAYTTLTFWKGKIITVYEEAHYERSKLLRRGTAVHEMVHWQHLKQYEGKGWGWGLVLQTFAYAKNWRQWELEAYQAQACYLRREIGRIKPEERLGSRIQDWNELNEELSRVNSNIVELTGHLKEYP